MVVLKLVGFALVSRVQGCSSEVNSWGGRQRPIGHRDGVAGGGVTRPLVNGAAVADGLQANTALLSTSSHSGSI
jgi:hypothetical protein